MAAGRTYSCSDSGIWVTIVSDDEIDELTPDNAPSVGTNQQPLLKSRILNEESVNNMTASKDPQRCSLHPSLLKNQNFVKIVAHKYLANNPMLLDEDSALLVAQHSTKKALREMEATGRPIDRGPVYDVAVKVLGPDVLNKYQKTLSDTEKILSEAATNDEPKLKGDLMLQEPQRPNLGPVPLTPLPTAPTGVPVRLIKKAAPLPLAQPVEECILSDDDELLLVAPTTSPARPVSSRSDSAWRKLPRKILSNPQTAQDKLSIPVKLLPDSTPTHPQSVQIKIIGNTTVKVCPPRTPATVQQPTSLSSTELSTILCLDSEDEDATCDDSASEAPARPQPSRPGSQPVPASITAAFPVPDIKATPVSTNKSIEKSPKHASNHYKLRSAYLNALPHSAGIDATQKSKTPKSKTPVSKGTAKTCKPGDFMRIDKDGLVEVLNKRYNNSASNNTKEATCSKKKKDEPATAGVPPNNVVTGSGKNIILTPQNILVGGVIRPRNDPMTPPGVKTRAEVEKLPATKVEPEQRPKRKKTKPTTLKDFSVSDSDF